MKRLVAVAAVLAVLWPAGTAAEDPIPARPEELHFKPLAFVVPEPDSYRHQLANGVTVYVAEDSALPLVEVVVRVRAGAFLDPADKTGLSYLMGRLLRYGGTEELSAEQFDEAASVLATEIKSFSGRLRGGASLNGLTRHFDEALSLFFDMLRRPAFQEDRLRLEKEGLYSQMQRRASDAEGLRELEWELLLYGPEHFSARLPTAPGVISITREDLAEFHRRFWHPANMVLTVSGNVDTEKVLARLEEEFADWPAGEACPWPPPAPSGHRPAAGLYHRAQNDNRTWVAIGHLGPSRVERFIDPELDAAAMANEILGGGGFSSRLTRRLRSEEGWVYSVESELDVGLFWPGSLEVLFASEPSRAAEAVAAVAEEIRRLVGEPPSPQELALARSSLSTVISQNFKSPKETALTFSLDHVLGWSDNYWQTYLERLWSISPQDVLAASKKYFHPDKLLVLVIGPMSDEDVRSLQELTGLTAYRLPYRDPMTLESF